MVGAYLYRVWLGRIYIELLKLVRVESIDGGDGRRRERRRIVADVGASPVLAVNAAHCGQARM